MKCFKLLVCRGHQSRFTPFRKLEGFLIVISISVVLTSCNFIGLDYAYDFKYEYATEFGKHNCTAYEFIASRANDDFTLMKEAIDRTGLKEVFEDSIYTYFILENEDWADYLTSARYSSISQVPEGKLREYIKGYIIPGYYHTAELTPGLATRVNTLGKYVMSVEVADDVPTSSQNLHRFRVSWVGEQDLLSNKGCKSSNIVVNNGIVHVLHERLVYRAAVQ